MANCKRATNPDQKRKGLRWSSSNFLLNRFLGGSGDWEIEFCMDFLLHREEARSHSKRNDILFYPQFCMSVLVALIFMYFA